MGWPVQGVRRKGHECLREEHSSQPAEEYDRPEGRPPWPDSAIEVSGQVRPGRAPLLRSSAREAAEDCCGTLVLLAEVLRPYLRGRSRTDPRGVQELQPDHDS